MFKKFIIAYDHRADAKTVERAKVALEEENIEAIVFEDNGEANDYPVLASKAYEMYEKNNADGMLLMCGTGIGMSIAANKIKGVRAAAVSEVYSAILTRQHNDANVICMGARVIGVETAKMIVDGFLTAEYEGDRHQKRVDMITALEEKN